MRFEQPSLALAAPEGELFRKILTQAAFDGHVAEVGSRGRRPRSVLAELRHSLCCRGLQAAHPCNADNLVA